MISWLIHHKAPVVLATFSVTVLGVLAYVSLPREASPEVKIPVVTVVTPYVGVAPADVESLVTTPIENELADVKDLKRMTSMSAEGISLITLEFEPEASIEEALQQVRDRVNRARSELPEDVEETDVQEVAMSDFPIMMLTLGGPVDELRLKLLGEALQEEIERLPGVLEADLAGGRTREIRVEVDPHRLSHYGLSFDDVIGAIRQENVNIPGGDVRTGDANYLLRIPGEFTDARELENVAIKRVGDRPVFVRDVGRVVDGFADRETYARMNGEPAVSLAIKKRSGANILTIADTVREIADSHAETWPEGVGYEVMGDESKLVRDMVSELENGIITGLLLVIGVLLFFMGFRNSFFVGIAIPLSMLMAMLVIESFGLTLNMIVLFALILALGMLVDNAIVVVENIYRHLEEGKSLKQASIVGTQEVALAVAASTATTVAAFAPLLFWTGMMGGFMGYMPKTVVIVLICSLVVAVGVLPVVTSTLMKPNKKPKQGDAVEGEEAADPAKGLGLYKLALEWSIRHRYIAAFIGLLALVGTLVAYGELNHGVEFFAETEPSRATVVVRAPDGTDLDTTDGIVRQIELLLAGQENIDVFVAETGVTGGADPMAMSNAVANHARITIAFLPDPNTALPGQRVRVESTSATVDRLRDLVAEIAGAEISIEKERMGPPVGFPIAVNVSGDDFHELGRIAARVRRDLAEIEGTTSLRDNYRVGRPELRLRIDRGAAKRVGASTQSVAQTIRTAVAGALASTLRDGEDDYDIMVRLAPEHRADLQSVLALRIPGSEDTSPDTYPVPLSTVASYEVGGGNGSIAHIDQDLVVSVTGDVAEGFNQSETRERVQAYMDSAELPPGFHLSQGGASDEQQETEEFLSRAFLIALFLIALVLVSQFNSFLKPAIILASVVLSLIGVLWGLILTGTPFGIMMTGLGVISLAGIVVNNAIVLIDYVEQLRARGMEAGEALVQAGLTRFRPVLLTAITTVLGLMPMAIGVSVDFRRFTLILGSQSASWWGPMAVAVIAGLVVATVLTLVMVPTLYSIVEDLNRLGRRTLQGFRRTPPVDRNVSGIDAAE